MSDYPIISADSHITEAPTTYTDYIDRAWLERAPRIQSSDAGDVYWIDGNKIPVPLGIVAAAGKPAEEIRMLGTRFEDLHRGGWDPEARLADQARDGVAAEILYPTVGTAICNHRDFDYKRACFEAYNRWIAEYCSPHPARLLGCGQTAMRTPDEGIADLQAIKAFGLRGVMMPGHPGVEDYDSTVYDEFWEAAVGIGLPLSFHILTTRDSAPTRGPRMNAFLSIIRGCQDIMGTLVLGGVFERHPALRFAITESTTVWVPEALQLMDQRFSETHFSAKLGDYRSHLSLKPSEYFRRNVFLGASCMPRREVELRHEIGLGNIMWGTDYPHPEGSWPVTREQQLESFHGVPEVELAAMLGGNAARVYGFDVEKLAPLVARIGPEKSAFRARGA